MNIRKAKPQDAPQLAELIYQSGPEGLEYVFRTKKKSPQDFLNFSLRLKGGEFGYGCHWIVENEHVIGGGAFFSGEDTLPFLFHNGYQILRFYGIFNGISVIVRGLRMEKILLPPKRNTDYIAHLAVNPSMRSKGIGSALIREMIRSSHKKAVHLDVAVTNPRAKVLYEGMGFKEIWIRVSRLRRNSADVPSYIRMNHTRN